MEEDDAFWPWCCMIQTDRKDRVTRKVGEMVSGEW